MFKGGEIGEGDGGRESEGEGVKGRDRGEEGGRLQRVKKGEGGRGRGRG